VRLKKVNFLTHKENLTMAQETKKKVMLKPLGNRVVAKRLEEEQIARGGIILPESAKKKQESAEVIAIGTGKVNDNGTVVPMPVKVGDKILMDKYSSQEVTIDDVEYIIVKADDIIAVIE
jgi:chaperonin GroES